MFLLAITLLTLVLQSRIRGIGLPEGNLEPWNLECSHGSSAHTAEDLYLVHDEAKNDLHLRNGRLSLQSPGVHLICIRYMFNILKLF